MEAVFRRMALLWRYRSSKYCMYWSSSCLLCLCGEAGITQRHRETSLFSVLISSLCATVILVPVQKGATVDAVSSKSTMIPTGCLLVSCHFVVLRSAQPGFRIYEQFSTRSVADILAVSFRDLVICSRRSAAVIIGLPADGMMR